MIVCEGNRLEESDLALVEIAQNAPKVASNFDEVARTHIMQVLEECGGVIEGANGASVKLGLKPATLRSRMKRLGIARTRGGFEAQPPRP